MSHKLIAFLVCLSMLLNPIFGALAQTGPERVPASPATSPFASDRLIVKLRPEVKVEKGNISTHIVSLDKTLTSIDAIEFEPVIGLEATYILKMEKGTDVNNAVLSLNNDPAVEYAEPDFLAFFASAPNDTRYSEQWGLSKISIEGAWDKTTGTPNVVIAVVDSGLHLAHEDLASNLWNNPGEIPSNGLDDDNNGFIDDSEGWNFVDSTNNVQDYIGHGSLVAGVAAARINNAIGIAGVCGNCGIMPIKVSNTSGSANYSDIAKGVVYATQKGAKVINISLGGYANSITLKNAIDAAVAQNIVVVAAAGNDNSSSFFYPAVYENVIAVAGTDQTDHKTASSNFGTWVDLSAPGQGILSTDQNGGYGLGQGTSYAAPFVSGAAGLLLTLHPERSPTEILSTLRETSVNLDNLNPNYAGLLGTGRLNVTAPTCSVSGHITSPTNNYATGPGSLSITATTESLAGQSVVQVEFFAKWDGTWRPIGIDAKAPFSVDWQIPSALNSQLVYVSIDVVGSDDCRVDRAGGIVNVSFVESLDNPMVLENWTTNRSYLNQRSLNPPRGDDMCSAASMAMVLAMEGLVSHEYAELSAKAIEMYPKVLVGDTAYVYKMVEVLKKVGTSSRYFGPMSNDDGWIKIKEQIDNNHALIVRTDGMTPYGHYIVAVGYQEKGTTRKIVVYDPFGEWKGVVCSELGSGCPGNYYPNTTEPGSYLGKWVYYDFDKIFGDYLIIAPKTQPSSSINVVGPENPPDEISDEPRVTGTYEGAPDSVESFIWMPMIVR